MHLVKRMPRALLQPFLPQTLRRDSPVALPHAELCEFATLNIREETHVDGASRTPTEAGPQRAGISNRDSEEEGVHRDRSVYRALADIGMEGRVKERLVRLRPMYLLRY